MIRNFRPVLVTAILPAILLLIPAGAHAQRGAHAVAAPMASSHRVMVRPSGNHTARAAVTTNAFSSGNGFGSTFVSSNGFGPGFGFGTGVNQNLGIEAAIDPATQWRLYTAAR